MSESAFDKLRPKHKLFVLAYIEYNFHGTKAYQKVYSSTEKTAGVNAAKLLENTIIKQAVEEKAKDIYTNMQSDIEKSKTYRMLQAIGKVNIKDIVDWDSKTFYVKDLKDIPEDVLYAVQSVENVERETKNGIDRQIKVTLVSKIKALELLSKIQGLIDSKDDTQQIEIVVKPAIRPDRKFS